MMRIIRDVDLWFLIEDSKHRRIVLFIDEKYYKGICRVFHNIDVEIDYAVDVRESDNLHSVYDLMYENPDEIMIVVAKEDFAYAKELLEGMGFKRGVNFKNIKKYTLESLSVPYYYDPICGYNIYTDDKKYNGFKIFGDLESTHNIRILTMGGSTTDAFLYPFKSWSEFLHETLITLGMPNVVLCGGVSGYSSSDELFKLIRDGMQLHPDIVINYSGCNDIKLGKYPYINSYMKRICGYLDKQNNSIGTRFESNSFGITWGIDFEREENPRDNYLFWSNNQKMIHSVCECFGIRHITIYQPNLCNGKTNMSQYEKEYLANICYCGVQKQSVEENMVQSMQFRKKAEDDAVKIEWMEDISSIFDDADVYIDRLHVNEVGNKMIAEKIAGFLQERKWI